MKNTQEFYPSLLRNFIPELRNYMLKVKAILSMKGATEKCLKGLKFKLKLQNFWKCLHMDGATMPSGQKVAFFVSFLGLLRNYMPPP